MAKLSRIYSAAHEKELAAIAKTPRTGWKPQLEEFAKRNNMKYMNVYAKTVTFFNGKTPKKDDEGGTSRGKYVKKAASKPDTGTEREPSGRISRKRKHGSPLTQKDLIISPNEIRFTVQSIRFEKTDNTLEFIVEI